MGHGSTLGEFLAPDKAEPRTDAAQVRLHFDAPPVKIGGEGAAFSHFVWSLTEFRNQVWILVYFTSDL